MYKRQAIPYVAPPAAPAAHHTRYAGGGTVDVVVTETFSPSESWQSRYRLAGEVQWTGTHVEQASNARTRVLRGLQPDAVYQIGVSKIAADGTMSAERVLEVVTL